MLMHNEKLIIHNAKCIIRSLGPLGRLRNIVEHLEPLDKGRL